MKKTLALSFLFAFVVAGFAWAGGDAAADKKKAADDRAEAKKDWEKAKKEYEDLKKDAKAYWEARKAFFADRAAARKLWHDAAILDKDAAKEARKEAITAELDGVDAGIAAINDQLKSDSENEKHWDTQVADEKKSLTDAQNGAKTEQDAKIKATYQGLADSITSELKNDEGSQTAAKNQVAADNLELKGLNDLKKQLNDELAKLK
jgi:hypothetical protein